MAAESFLWTIPLLVFGFLAGTSTLFAARGGGAPPVEAMGPMAKLTLALGAGVYEELLFRLIIISLVHALLVDALKMTDKAGFVIAAIISAIAFTLYHNIRLAEGGLDVRVIALYMGAGLYFGALFITRGFGVVVAAHAVYDIVVLLLLGSG
jgi:membrane protease YdiL (CAAX protease family)